MKGIGIEIGEIKMIVVKVKIGNENDVVIRVEGIIMILIVIEIEIGIGEIVSGNEVDFVNGFIRKSGNIVIFVYFFFF